MRRHRATLALVAWTAFVWATRIDNIWSDADLTTGEKLGRTGLAVSFLVLVVAVLVALWRRARAATVTTVAALAGWNVAVWVVRDVRIVAADHDLGFKLVHVVLGVISIVLSVLAWREVRRAGPPAGAGGRVDEASAVRGTAAPRG